MNASVNACIVIPCYNESKNIMLPDYETFLSKNENTVLCFVDDGSTDQTLKTLNGLKQKFPRTVEVVACDTNSGKAQAVRTGVLYCCKNFDFKFIAYLDADLSVSIQECISLTRQLNETIVFCFGSRITRIGATIKRKRRRFLIGRVIATFISEILTLKVYDTQCGCKVFDKTLANTLFEKPFISRWLFDVEIFCRMIGLYGRENAITKMLEQPLICWIDRGDSKVKASYFFKLWIDLYKIRKTYRHILLKK